jgi:hypothetical protein
MNYTKAFLTIALTTMALPLTSEITGLSRKFSDANLIKNEDNFIRHYLPGNYSVQDYGRVGIDGIFAVMGMTLSTGYVLGKKLLVDTVPTPKV